jgi:2'-5' RNA ligase
MQEEDKTAIAIVPSFDVWEPINAIRRVHDKSIARWDPHCNLFFPGPVFGNVPDLLRDALKDVPSFTLEATHFYRNAGSRYVELGFRDTSQLIGLREIVRKTLNLPNDKVQYEPHITVGQHDQGTADAFIQQLQATWVPLVFQVEEVCLLNLEKKRYRPITKIALATEYE